jgi:predicted nucleic acid-binding protein
MGELRRQEADAILYQLGIHLQDNLYRRLSFQRDHFRTARDFIARFSSSLRTLDALHIALAASHGLELITADKALADSAALVSVPTVLLREP